MKRALHHGLLAAFCAAGTIATAPVLAGEIGSAPSATASGLWQMDPLTKIALVEGTGQHPGSLLGVQCDRNDLRSRRLVFGATRRLDRTGILPALASGQPTFLRISIESQSTYAEFVTDIEERTSLDYNGTADLVVSYLTPEQYNLVRSARSVTVTAGERSFWFTGKGSATATAALSCTAAPQVRASRVIANVPAQGPSRPVLTPWSFTPRLLSADTRKGRYLAFTSAVGFAENPLASFNFEISCHGNRLYAAFTTGSVAKSVPGTAGDSRARFLSTINASDNVAEIYRNGRAIAQFPVEMDASGKGHMLSARELAALLEFNSIVVSTRRASQTVEFTAKGGPEAVSALAEACGTVAG